jgi:hypothetical protein
MFGRNVDTSLQDLTTSHLHRRENLSSQPHVNVVVERLTILLRIPDQQVQISSRRSAILTEVFVFSSVPPGDFRNSILPKN